MSNWRNYQHDMDDTVDTFFAEPVELHPWQSTQSRYTETGGPDPDRAVVSTMGIYVRPGASVTGEGAMGAATRIVQQDIWVSIVDHKLGASLLDWRKGDHVYFPERGEWYEISYPGPSATARPQFYLLRLQDPVDPVA